MHRLERKNNKLNNAAAGAARGFGAGIALGQRTRSLDIADEDAKAQRALALRSAARADQALQMEQADRARQAGAREAIGQAANEMGRESFPPIQFSDNPMTGPASAVAQGEVNHQAIVQKVAGIRTKMAEMGVPLSQIEMATEAIKQRHKEIADEGARKMLRDRIARASQDGSMFAPQLDGTMAENLEAEKTLNKATELVSNPNVPVAEAQRVFDDALTASRNERKRFKRREATLSRMDAKIAEIQQPRDPSMGPQTVSEFNGQKKRAEYMSAMREFYADHQDQIESNPAIERDFYTKLLDVERDVYGISPTTHKPVSFAQADMADEYEAAIKQQAAELAQYKAQREQANIANDATRAQAAATNAETNRAKLALPRPQRPAADTSVADYTKIAEIVDNALLTDKAYKDLDTPEEKAKYRADKIAQEREAARTLGGQAAMDKSVLGNRPGKPEREKFARENVNNFTSKEELDAYLENGTEPKWMKKK